MEDRDRASSVRRSGKYRRLPQEEGVSSDRDDLVVATGRVRADGGRVRLAAIGRGHYDHVLQHAAGIEVLTDLPLGFQREGVTTVQGYWDGQQISDARVVAALDPVRLPEHLGDRIDLSIIPTGRVSHSDALAPDLLAALDRLRADVLVSYVAHQLPDGWVGVASTTDSTAARDALEPFLGDAFALTRSPWGEADLDAIDEIFEAGALRDELLDIGRFVDPFGRLRVCALVRALSADAAAELDIEHADAVVVTSWMSRSASAARPA
ncbi:hypothetical protein [Rathayibacter sp. VKM Ac-2857]|uniref:hypothetical protein n=1 Tax=Rathayibacter sp. VKM Ac-2857 TaxID=2739020 RepID=UPI001563C760|nr:hypothetical protein [Rathayibacter sp. VKM Ac-2857]NQX14779.1 hypothetical protein [Rathayibacter sp. VKM Ac-2857]